jgi:hypothetical protein
VTRPADTFAAAVGRDVARIALAFRPLQEAAARDLTRIARLLEADRRRRARERAR